MRSSAVWQSAVFSDPRQAWKVAYPLPEILLVVLCATMAGAEDFAEVERWGKRKLDFPRRLLPFARGISSRDTLNDVMNGAALRRVLYRLGRGPARGRARDRRHRPSTSSRNKTSRRARAATQRRCISSRPGPAPTSRARPGGGRRQRQRDHRDPAPCQTTRTHRSLRHHRRDQRVRPPAKVLDRPAGGRSLVARRRLHESGRDTIEH